MWVIFVLFGLVLLTDIADSLTKIARCCRWYVDYLRDPARTKEP